MPPGARTDVLSAWRSIPEVLSGAVRGLDDSQLDLRNPRNNLTVREQTHHLVEAHVVASSIVIAALGMPGSTYDWSWMMPFGPWMDRLPYRSMPLGPSLEALRALNAWLAAVVEGADQGLSREVRLRDSPEAEPRPVTVAELLRQEVDHTEEHVAEIRATLERSRSGA